MYFSRPQTLDCSAHCKIFSIFNKILIISVKNDNLNFTSCWTFLLFRRFQKSFKFMQKCKEFCLMNFEGFFLREIFWDICFHVITEILRKCHFLCILRFTCRLSSPPYSFLKVKINDLGLTPFMHDVTLDDFLCFEGIPIYIIV